MAFPLPENTTAIARFCKRTCCPEVHRDNETGDILVSDDFEGMVRMTREEWHGLISDYIVKHFPPNEFDALDKEYTHANLWAIDPE